MASLRTQNALLFIIALCLVLLVVHFYSGHLVARAQAQTAPLPPTAPADPQAVHLYGCFLAYKGSGTCSWIPVKVDQTGIVWTSK